MNKRISDGQKKLLDEMGKALTNLTNTAVSERIELRNAVCDYVALEHERDTAIHKVIDTVTQILRKAEREAGNTSAELARQLVDWCLEFHPASTAPPSAQAFENRWM